MSEGVMVSEGVPVHCTRRYNFYKVSQVVVSGIFENTAMLMDFELIQAPKTLKKLGARARGQPHR